MILGRGLETTGALQPLAAALARLWTRWPVFSLLTTLVAAAFFSAFVNNTPIVVLLLPILVGVSLRSEVRASSVLMTRRCTIARSRSCASSSAST